MKLEIEPYCGVGPIKFGMTTGEVRMALRNVPVPFFKSPDSVIPVDAFDELGLHVYYNPHGKCEAVEMGLAADPLFLGHRLIERPFGQLLVWLGTMDDSIEIDESGLTSLKFGFGLYAPGARARQEVTVEGVIVFEKHYYG